MMRFIMPVVLVGIGLTVFFVFTNPIYNDIREERVRLASYNQALSNSKVLENERDKLTAKYNSINRDDLIRLQKLLPDNIDNIRLILEIEQIAAPYGMFLKDVKYSATADAEDEDVANKAVPGAVVQGGGAMQAVNKDYGVWDLEFSTTGTYNNFLNFTRDLERNLRVVDISSIQFSSGTVNAPGSAALDSYTYNFKIKTYWLKN